MKSSRPKTISIKLSFFGKKGFRFIVSGGRAAQENRKQLGKGRAGRKAWLSEANELCNVIVNEDQIEGNEKILRIRV